MIRLIIHMIINMKEKHIDVLKTTREMFPLRRLVSPVFSWSSFSFADHTKNADLFVTELYSMFH